MILSTDNFSRISKCLVDRDELTPDEVARRRARHQLVLACGPEVAESSTLQAALLTAAATAVRCFPGAVTLSMPDAVADMTLCVPYGVDAGGSLLAALRDLGVQLMPVGTDTSGTSLVFGSRSDVEAGLQITFDGWVGAAVPVAHGDRLRERDRCVLAGVLAGALGVAETFFNFASTVPAAGYRPVGLSLWQPGADWRSDAVVGPPLDLLPAEFWLLGLGHLGQAYLWSIGLLPFQRPGAVSLVLNDFDKVEWANYETGVLTTSGDQDQLKTRVAQRWLQARGFNSKLLERRFDEHLRRQANEPRLAICGFDAAGPRWALERAEFGNIIECGLGGRHDDFDTIALHTLPHPTIRAETEWPKKAPGDDDRRIERLARTNKVYREHADAVRCGEVELAGKSVAVPFVGAAAASLAVAEAVRAISEGARVGTLRMQLSAMDHASVRLIPDGYAGANAPLLEFCRVRK